MMLAIDIGNSRIKYGLFKDSNLEQHASLHSIAEINFNKFQFRQAAISSVVPDKTDEIAKTILETTGIIPFVIDIKSKFNLNIDYQSPDTLGIDRLCSCESAFEQINRKLTKDTFLLTLDFGTATTINVIKPPNIFIGGVIAPGIRTMFESLNNNTSQLPEIQNENYDGNIGNDTKSSILSGVINSTIGLINEVSTQLRMRNDCNKIKIFITGGMASRIKHLLKIDYIYDEFLVLRGINAIFKLNNPR